MAESLAPLVNKGGLPMDEGTWDSMWARVREAAGAEVEVRVRDKATAPIPIPRCVSQWLIRV